MSMSGIASMLAQTGANVGQRIGAPVAGLGQGLGGMLQGRAERQRQQETAQEVQRLLQQNANNPAQLNSLGQKYASEGNDEMAKLFFNAAKTATAKETAGQQRGVQGGLMAITQAASRGVPLADLREGVNSVLMQGGTQAQIMEAYNAGKGGTGGSSFRQEIFDPVSGTMQQVNFLTDQGGRVVGQQVLGASAGPEKPTITVKEKDGIFYTFENGVPVGEYESRSAAEAAANLLYKFRIAAKKEAKHTNIKKGKVILVKFTAISILLTSLTNPGAIIDTKAGIKICTTRTKKNNPKNKRLKILLANLFDSSFPLANSDE